MTRTTPLRLITLHFVQIFLTDARTFIVLLPFSAHLKNAREILQKGFQPSTLSCQSIPPFEPFRHEPAKG
jgi:hypothetical protein